MGDRAFSSFCSFTLTPIIVGDGQKIFVRGKRLGLIVHHTDAEREWAYDRDSSSGRLDRGLDDAAANGWLLIDMSIEWRQVFSATQ